MLEHEPNQVEPNKKPCSFCGKMISVQNMSVHVKRCKVRNDCDHSAETMDLMKKLISENKQLKTDLHAQQIAFNFLDTKYDNLLTLIVQQHPPPIIQSGGKTEAIA